ncbi:hypothetical protein [Polaribacter butkevichii]|uniref:WG repeat-containing protein n=1 Tax=Polaribacter butkevichii TaxID=218490 RepID=A0A2P6C8E2_9FLAO|nr:hypothetical protein [Polaribacter butkevichii]PQJ69194.1 hypothetical protein BTO14_14305 [Polaribacter butkevichii]
MRKLFLTLLCLFTFTLINAQSNQDIANVYIKRAKEAIETSINYKEALVQFNKSLKFMDTITDRNVASLASLIYYENYLYQSTDKERLVFLKKAESYSRQYFLLTNNKTSEEYASNLENLILIKETIEEIEIKVKKEEEERIRKEKEHKKIDSLKTIWKHKSETLSLKIDSIYAFNANNIALYTKAGNFGVIDDRGRILLEATTYQDGLNAEGFILLKNTKEEPTKIYCFNTNDKNGFLLPDVSAFNATATHYGKLMLPRGNGRLVTYPNNSSEPMVYDLNVKKIVKVSDNVELFKSLKKDDIIDKYNKDGEVKVHKEWYLFGGDLGGKIYPLYTENMYDVHSFLCAASGKLLSAESGYKYIGAFYEDKSQVIKKDKVIWIDQEGAKVSAAKDAYKNYKGDSKVVKLEAGIYQILRNDVIVLGDEELEKMGEFLRKHKGN